MLKQVLIISFIISVFIASCGEQSEKKEPKSAKEVNKEVLSAISKESSEKSSQPGRLSYVVVKTWIDDFRNFRSAVYNNDLPKLKTYINFPFDDPGSTIFHLANLSEKEWTERKAKLKNSDLFYKEDFERYHQKIFDERFEKCILKIKSEDLFTKQISRTKMFAEKDIVYQLVAEYDEGGNTLSLNMTFGNNFRDESGNLISEGENNIIYQFKVIGNKKLRLYRIDVAG